MKRFAVLGLFFLSAFFWLCRPLAAQSFFEDLQLAYKGNIILFASDNGPGSDPSQIVPSLGFSVSYPILRMLSIEFIEDIYFTNYEYNFIHGYPMACSIENRKSFVLGFTTGFQASGVFPMSDKGAAVRVFGGITCDLRLILKAISSYPGDEIEFKKHTDAITSYFWENGRFLFVPAGVGMDFPVNSNFLLGFDLRVWIPLYRLWTDQNIPFIDGWRFGLAVRITPRK